MLSSAVNDLEVGVQNKEIDLSIFFVTAWPRIDEVSTSDVDLLLWGILKYRLNNSHK
jgi:hypothetical protein